MPNPPINIASLDFTEVKTSLINYLKTQKNFNSYNFESTALSTLLDVLAYNTMFYGYYANVVANESFLDTSQITENILSSIKPLGYVINGVNASKTKVSLTGNDITIEPYTSQFIGTNSAGENFNFYTTKSYILNSIQPVEVTVYETSSLIKNKQISGPGTSTTDSLDLVNQSYKIGGFNIDINTLSVAVNGENWSLYNPYASVIKFSTDKIYFIERRADGFYLLFAKPGLDEIFSFPGARTIVSTDTVQISYIIPSGDIANGAEIVITPGTLVSGYLSSGGGSPDIELIKTFAPKLFASSDRAVTKDDYYAIILNSGLLPKTITTIDQILIWGGEELNNPIFGKVYYSLADITQTPQTTNSLTNYLKDKSILTVTPEFVPPKFISVYTVFKYTGPQPLFIIKQGLENYYNSNKKFNKSFSLNDFILYMTTNFSKTSELDILSTTLNLNINSFNNFINLNNPLKIPSTTNSGSVLTSSSFILLDKVCYFKDKLVSGTKGKIIIEDSSGNIVSDAGTIDYTTGDIYINKQYLSTGGVNITINPRNIKLLNPGLATVYSLVSEIRAS